MTIGYVLDDTLDKPDGVQQAVIVIAERMRALGHDVHYIVAETKRKDLKNVHSVSKLIPFKFNGNSTRTPLISSKRKIKRLLKENKFDVLHVQMPYSPLMAGRVIKLADKETKIVGTFHILPYSWVSRVGTTILGYWLSRNKKRFDKVYAVSPPALEFMKNNFGVEGSVIPNPVDYNFFHKQAVKKRSLKKKRIIFVGRFETRKGVRQLVEAYELLTEEVRSKIELKMAGKGPLLNELRQYSKQKRLDIKFPGFISDEQKAKSLAQADIAIFPSTSGESFGIVLTEAMSAGAGITLGGNNPGYSSVLTPWPYTLFDATDPVKIAGKITELTTNDKKRLEIGQSQHQAVKQYDINTVVDKLLKQAY